MPEGWHGWDAYAPFYDWENRRTLGRRDVKFWRDLATRVGGPVLELGCGTGRVSLPVARAGVPLVGVDRSAAMLRVARRRLLHAKSSPRVRLVRGDIRALPFLGHRPFELVIAPYGIVQSLLNEADLTAMLASVARITRTGGLIGIDMVPDVPRWREYSGRITHAGRADRGARITLVESVRQEPGRRLTVFDQEYRVARPGGRPRVSRFTLTFRTLSVRQMTHRLERAGFAVEGVLGGYDGAPWDRRADVWVILARRA